MRISKEVIDQLIIGTQCVPPDYIKTAQAVIQAYLSEILKQFDASDKKTWPKNKGKGYFYLVRYKDGTYNYLHFYGENGSIWRGVTHYLDPADILPKEDK